MDGNAYHNWQMPTLDTTFQWDYSSAGSPTAVFSHDHDLLQRAADFYATLNSPTDDWSNSGLDSPDPSSPHTRSSSSASNVAQVKNSIPDKLGRRREQNRFSQRAYRERKDRYQRELEQQISDCQSKHQMLCRSYSQQSKEVDQLKAQVEQLKSKILSSQNGLPGSLSHTPAEFNLVPFYDSGRFLPSSPRKSKSHS